MRVLITGGSGFLGAAVCRELLEQGFEVRVLDNAWRQRERDQAPDVEYVDADVRDYGAVLSATKNCEMVWHLAYINGTRFFYEKPDLVMEVAIKGTLNTIEAACAVGVRRYVLASSSEVYQQPTHLPTTEAERLIVPDVGNARYSYGGGKVAAELMTLNIAAHRGLETVIFRPHNFYGANMGFEHVVPELVAKMIRASDGLNRRQVRLELQGDGSDTRAFCHVIDGARGSVLAGVHGACREVYHVGTSEEVSIGALAEQIADILGLGVELVPGPKAAGATTRRCPSIAKLIELGYRPTIPLEQGLAEAVRWYSDYYLHHGEKSQ